MSTVCDRTSIEVADFTRTAYAMGKIGMSVLVKGLAMDFERQGRHDMAINAIWPAAVCGISLPAIGTPT